MVRNPLSPLAFVFALAPLLVAVPLQSALAQIEQHITIDDPADLTPEQAEQLYSGLRETLRKDYRLAAYGKARDYQSWRRYNTTPYLSATHGNRYVNNYGNWAAKGYESLGPGKTLAEGTVLAKDAFTVRKDGTALAAPLFIMEKLASGVSPDTGDWRYVMVLPDGSVFGDSHGAAPDRMAFCHECHAAVADTDYVFYVPEEVRADE